MSLTALPVTRSLPELNEVRDLLRSAFPRSQQMPVWLLLLLSKRRNVDFLAFYDGDALCGFSFEVGSADMLFVMYLAVSGKIRSRGYGSRMLDDIKRRAGERPVVLDIEPLDPKADNYSQRVRRLEFYRRNGFFETGHVLREPRNEYTLLSTDGTLDPRALRTTLGALSFGLYVPRVVRAGQKAPNAN